MRSEKDIIYVDFILPFCEIEKLFSRDPRFKEGEIKVGLKRKKDRKIIRGV